jgi:hypothetical protein
MAEDHYMKKHISLNLACLLIITSVILSGCTTVIVNPNNPAITTFQTTDNVLSATTTSQIMETAASANAELAEVETAAQAAAASGIGGNITAVGIGPGSLNVLAPYISGEIVGYYWINANGTVDITDAAPLTQPTSIYASPEGPYYSSTASFSTTTGQFH